MTVLLQSVLRDESLKEWVSCLKSLMKQQQPVSWTGSVWWSLTGDHLLGRPPVVSVSSQQDLLLVATRWATESVQSESDVLRLGFGCFDLDDLREASLLWNDSIGDSSSVLLVDWRRKKKLWWWICFSCDGFVPLAQETIWEKSWRLKVWTKTRTSGRSDKMTAITSFDLIGPDRTWFTTFIWPHVTWSVLIWPDVTTSFDLF